jgi:hypothetical protein
MLQPQKRHRFLIRHGVRGRRNRPLSLPTCPGSNGGQAIFRIEAKSDVRFGPIADIAVAVPLAQNGEPMSPVISPYVTMPAATAAITNAITSLESITPPLTWVSGAQGPGQRSKAVQ